MLVLMLRTVFIYFTIVFSMRLMGKKQLGELQPSELVSTILLSNLASICIESPEIPIAGSVVPVLLIVCLEILVSALSARSSRFSALLSGSPKTIIRHGILDQKALHQLRFSADDVLEALRGKDVFELEDVALAIVETNGSVSICRRPGAEPLTPDDLPLKKQTKRLPRLPVVVMGRPDRDAMANAGLTEERIAALLRRERCPLKQVLLLLCDETGQYRLIRREEGASAAGQPPKGGPA